MSKRRGPIGVMVDLFKRHAGWSLIAAGAILVIWSSIAIRVSEVVQGQNMTMETAVYFVLPVGIASVLAGAGVQIATYQKSRRQAVPPDSD